MNTKDDHRLFRRVLNVVVTIVLAWALIQIIDYMIDTHALPSYLEWVAVHTPIHDPVYIIICTLWVLAIVVGVVWSFIEMRKAPLID